MLLSSQELLLPSGLPGLFLILAGQRAPPSPLLSFGQQLGQFPSADVMTKSSFQLHYLRPTQLSGSMLHMYQTIPAMPSSLIIAVNFPLQILQKTLLFQKQNSLLTRISIMVYKAAPSSGWHCISAH